MPKFDLILITTVEADTYEDACDYLRDWADGTADENQTLITSEYPGMARESVLDGQRLFFLHPLSQESKCPLAMGPPAPAAPTGDYSITVQSGDGEDITRKLAEHDSIDAGRNENNQAIGSLDGLTTDEALIALCQIIDQGNEWGPDEDIMEAGYRMAAAIVERGHGLLTTGDGWIIRLSKND